jgi:hypothetical protein
MAPLAGKFVFGPVIARQKMLRSTKTATQKHGRIAGLVEFLVLLQ